MRFVLALVVAFIVAACALEQSGSDAGFVHGDAARSARAAIDAEVILQGMAQARDATERVARDTGPTAPGAALPPVAR